MTTPTPRRYLVYCVITALMAVSGALSNRVAAVGSTLVISEVHAAGNDNGTYAANWFEVTNTGAAPVDITGWKVDDSTPTFGTAVALRGVTSIPAGTSVIFIEGNATGTNDAAKSDAFKLAWFGPTPAAGLLIGAYGGSGIGLSASGDAVNLFDRNGAIVVGVTFGAARPTSTFDNSDAQATIITYSGPGFNGAFLSTDGKEIGSPGVKVNSPIQTTLNIANYHRIGRFSLPVPTVPQGQPLPYNVLAQEASAVTYNWDTDTLFIVGDGGSNVLQITKAGQLINSMTLATGLSPQGTEFYDTEGIAYVGGGKFVMVEERDRRAVLFTYVAGTTLTRAAVKDVTLGTFRDNTGIEGISFDPLSGGFVAVKEGGVVNGVLDPQGLFQTAIDFDAGTASNGGPGLEESVNLFPPSALHLLDLADIFALSNLPAIGGTFDPTLLVLSQEEGKIVHTDRAGNILESLQIRRDPATTQTIASHQHEGMTTDRNGILYVVNENGGGDIRFPQLWVYAPATEPNQAPTLLTLNNQVTQLAESTGMASSLRVADIAFTDDDLGTNILSVTGPDAAFFEIANDQLFLKAGTRLDFETKNSYTVTVAVDDASIGTTPDWTATFTLALTDVLGEVPAVPTIIISEVAAWSNNSPVGADWFEVTNTSTAPVTITGWKMDDDSNSFDTGAELKGIASIAGGESVIFLESTDANFATRKAAFLNIWFGANPPAGLKVGNYSAGNVGLSAGGDAVNVFDQTGALKGKVILSPSPAGPALPTFDNGAGIDGATLSRLSIVGLFGAFAAAGDTNEVGSPGTTGDGLIVSEVAPWSSGNSPLVLGDWFELTNIGPREVDITGWKVDDNTGSPASASISGIASIASGESVILVEGADLAAKRQGFIQTWFGASAPAGLQIGVYFGTDVGLSTGGDSVHLFDSSNALRARVTFGASSAGPTFRTFDNAIGLNGAGISRLSEVGVFGAFTAANGSEVGSPGTGVTPKLVISEVAAFSSGRPLVGADWFELTNIGARPADISGWKMDDDSNVFGSATPLVGITSIAPGESVIFLETADLASALTKFVSAWFGPMAPAGLQFGIFSGIGLSTSTDAVNLFDSAGTVQARVAFGSSPTGTFATFDNGLLLNNAAISQLSVVHVRGAFVAPGDPTEIGSPGTIVETPTVIRGGYGYVRATRQFLQQVTLRNDGAQPIAGPIYLALDKLTNATLANKNGTTEHVAPYGSPLVVVVAAGATLPSGASATVTLLFNNPTQAQMSYDPRVLVLLGNNTP